MFLLAGCVSGLITSRPLKDETAREDGQEEPSDGDMDFTDADPPGEGETCSTCLNDCGCSIGEYCSNNVCLLQVSGNTYFVATDGDDSAVGDFVHPWRTWGKAFNSAAVNPGDIVYFRGGVYMKDISEGDNTWYYPNRNEEGTGYEISRDGTADSYISYFNYPGETPILDCNNAYHAVQRLNWGIYSSDVNYVRLKGLTIRNVRQIEGRNMGAFGVQLSGNGLVIENCTFHNNYGVGLRVGSSAGGNAYVINSDSYDNCDHFSDALPGNDGYGFSVI